MLNSRSNLSPSRCPKESLIFLSPSMSQTITAREVFMRRQRATSCARWTNRERALGNPVRKSVVAELSACWYFKAFSTESRSEEHTSELQSLRHLVCRLLLEKK